MAFGDSLSVLDNFNRSDESPVAGWSLLRTSGFRYEIVSNLLKASADGLLREYWDDAEYGPACEVSIDIPTEGDNNDILYLCARVQDVGTITHDCYLAYWQLRAGADRLRLYRTDNFIDTQLGADEAIEVADGHKLGLECSSEDVHTVYYDEGSGWTACTAATATDTTYQSAGYLTVLILDQFWRLDNFSGGTISGVVTHQGTATLAGVGTLAANGDTVAAANATLAGVGTLTAAGTNARLGTVTLAGVGSLTAAGSNTRLATSTLSGIGSLTAAGSNARPGTATLSGVGSATAVGSRIGAGGATLAGVGSLAAIGTVYGEFFGTATLAGVGTLTAVGEVVAGGVVQEGTATLSGVGSLTAIGENTRFVATTLAGVGSLTAAGENARFGLVTMAGVGTLVADAQLLANATATLPGVGTLQAIGTLITTYYGTATLAGVGTLQAIGTRLPTTPAKEGGDDEREKPKQYEYQKDMLDMEPIARPLDPAFALRQEQKSIMEANAVAESLRRQNEEEAGRRVSAMLAREKVDKDRADRRRASSLHNLAKAQIAKEAKASKQAEINKVRKKSLKKARAAKKRRAKKKK